MAASSQLGISMLSMTSTQVRALSTTDISSLTADDLNALPAMLFSNFTVSQIASIDTSALSGLSGATFGELGRGKIAALTTDQVAALTATEVGMLSITKLGAMSAAKIGALSGDAFSTLGSLRVASLSVEQISALTSDDVKTLGVSKLAALSSEQIGAIASSEIAYLGVTRLSSLTSTQASALTTADLQAMNSSELSALVQGGLLTNSQLASILPSAMTGLAPSAFANLNLGALDVDQIADLTGDQIAQISPEAFGTIATLSIASIRVAAISGVTTSQMEGLSTSQLESFSTPQMGAMKGDQLSVIAIANPFIEEAGVVAGSSENLSYTEALSVLQSAASEPINQTTIDQLQAFANKLTTDDRMTLNGYDDLMVASNAVTQAVEGVILGSPENDIWYGGGTQAQDFGNLTSATTSVEFNDLIGNWFLGTNLPSLQYNAAGDVAQATYQQTSLPLFGTDGGPLMTDVVEGGVDDSALLAGLAETAQQDPGYLRSLFHDNGNGTYSVALPAAWGGDNASAIVNGELPFLSSGDSAFAQVNAQTGSWVALFEKAAVQGSVDSAIALRGYKTSLGNTYAELSLPSNADDEVSLGSGEIMSEWDFYNQTPGGTTPTAISQYLSTAEQSFDAGYNVVAAIGDHFFAVTGINSGTGAVGLYDPTTGLQSSISLATTTHTDFSIWYATAGGRAAPDAA